MRRPADKYADLASAYAEEVAGARAFNLPNGDRQIVRTSESGTNETVIPKSGDAAVEL